MGAWFLAESVSPTAALALGCILLADMVFYDLLKAPTRLGRKVLDRLEGFELYLSVAEEDRMNFHNPPERTPELFEKFLPYALALGVEQAWGERFAGVLEAASRDRGRSGSGPGRAGTRAEISASAASRTSPPTWAAASPAPSPRPRPRRARPAARAAAAPPVVAVAVAAAGRWRNSIHSIPTLPRCHARA